MIKYSICFGGKSRCVPFIGMYSFDTWRIHIMHLSANQSEREGEIVAYVRKPQPQLIN